jgi:alpha-glucosidase
VQFRNVTPAAFVARHRAPMVMTTRAHQLAQFVVYPSPLTMLADAPSAYENAGHRLVPGADFLRLVPTVWDKTQGAAGEWAKWIAVARRHGNIWYMGVLGDETARTVRVPLRFLGDGHWRVRAWIDGATPTDVTRRTGEVSAATLLGIPLSPSGGAALIFTRHR